MEHLQLLGQKTHYPDQYQPQILERFSNPHPGRDYCVRLHCPEFTTLCPITGQPDFATIDIAYIPAEHLVESKSLKIYLFSFRNHGGFHEDCINVILNDLCQLLQPKYLEVKGTFTPRGGIAIHPFANYAAAESPYEHLKQQRLLEVLA